MRGGGAKGGGENAEADAYGTARGRGGREWEAILVAAETYMMWMERLYAVDLAVTADDGNDDGGGRGGKAGAPGGDGTARVNG